MPVWIYPQKARPGYGVAELPSSSAMPAHQPTSPAHFTMHGSHWTCGACHAVHDRDHNAARKAREHVNCYRVWPVTP